MVRSKLHYQISLQEAWSIVLCCFLCRGRLSIASHMPERHLSVSVDLRQRHLLDMWVWCVDHTAPRNYSRSSPHSLQPQSGQSRHSVQELPQCCSHPHSSQIYLIRLSIWLVPLKTFRAITHVAFLTVFTIGITMRFTGTPMAFLPWH